MMKINDDHWLEEAIHEPISGGSPLGIRRFLVIHFTSGASAKSSIDFWRTRAAKGACAHVIIDRDGTIFQCRPFNRAAAHAGVSRWRDPKTGQLYLGANNTSLGIELANFGDDIDEHLSWTKLPVLRAKHQHEKVTSDWETFPAAQLDACTLLSRALVARYQLDDVTGHDCIAPERKNDPGPAFPMEVLRTACGFEGLSQIFWPNQSA